MNENEMRKMSREEQRKIATENYIKGLLFEVDIPIEEKSFAAKNIVEQIFNRNCWDKEEFQKIALGTLASLLAGKLPAAQIVAISLKIAKFV